MTTLEGKSQTGRRIPGPLASESYVPLTLPRFLGLTDMTTTFIVSIFLATTATTAVVGGPAAITYLLIGAVFFFLPCLIATSQLGHFFPYEGALYNWTHRALGGFWSFFAGFCAWFPGVLISVSLADLLVTYIQSMQPDWLVEPWQQGLVLIAVLVFTCLLSIQRFRTVQYVINFIVGLILLSSFLLGLSCIVWLVKGHPSVTNFSHWGDWGMNWGNITLFGFMVFAYIGTESALNLMGEVKEGVKGIINKHLLWGSIIIFVLYMVNTFSVLIVLGSQNGATPYAMVTLVDSVLGKPLGSIMAICLMSSFLATALVYNYLYARLLMIGGIDGRLPSGIARLNKNRVPRNAIVFQTILGILFTVIAFIFAPMLGIFGKPADFSAEVYYVAQAASVLVWAISAGFLFVNLVAYYLLDRVTFMRGLVFPFAVIWLCVVVGSISCVLAIADTLLYSWIPLIPNNVWGIAVGGVTMIFLITAVIGSMLANSEANWQVMNQN
jgi:amino acid transporter